MRSVLRRPLIQFTFALVALIGTISDSRAGPLEDCEAAEGDAIITACGKVVQTTTFTKSQIARAHALMATHHLNRNATDLAQPHIESALNLVPNSILGLVARARAAEQRNQFDAALADYTTLVESGRLNKDSLPATYYISLTNRGYYQLRRRAFDLAIQDFNEAIAADPRRPGAYNGRGEVARAKGDLAGAAADLRTAVERDPKHWASHTSLGEVLVAMNQPAEALAAFERALAINPRIQRAITGRDDLKKKLASTAPVATPPIQPAQPARTTPQTATPGATTTPGAQPPGSPAPADKAAADMALIRLAKARLALNAGKFDEVVTETTALLKQTPTDPVAQLIRARAFFAQRRYKDAAEDAEAAIGRPTATPVNKAEGHEILGEVFYAVGRFPDVIRVTSVALDLFPKRERSRGLRGMASFYIGNFKRAVDDFKVASEGEPSTTAWKGWLAYCLVSDGRIAEAEPVIASTKGLMPSPIIDAAKARFELARNNLALAKEALGRIPNEPRNNFAPASLAAQAVMLHELLKPTDAPLTSKR